MLNGHRMAAVDAQFYWMSAKIPNDQFLLYAFSGVPRDPAAAAAAALDRARKLPDLTVRVRDGGAVHYPRWVRMTEQPAPAWHRLADGSWAGCLDAVVRLAEDPLDIRRAPWRLHLFAPVRRIPGQDSPGTVAVLQVAHALADGARASALAAGMFGRATAVSAVAATGWGLLPWRAGLAAAAHRQQLRDTRAGLLPPPPGDRPVLVTNTRPAGIRQVRTLVRRRAQLRGPTVTVAVLAAVAEALSRYLDEPCACMGAEVPMAKSGVRLAGNHFANVRVGLYPQLGWRRRVERIAADLADARRRADHPTVRAADQAFAVLPAALLRWGVGKFDPDARPARVAGNTVVSSVYRGAADLSFGTCPAVLTAGFPGLSPAMGLTHGVHGIGDTIAVSVHAAESAIADIDAYTRLLDAALTAAER